MRSPVRASSRRLRLAATAAAVGVVGVGLWSPAASADTAGRVEFSGGCGLLGSGLGGRSAPDAAEVSVPAGAELEFANRLGQPATLRLDGETAAKLGPGDTVGVAFHDGPVTATMQISCLLGEPAGAVTVEVVPGTAPSAAQPSPQVDPVPSVGSSSSGSGGGPSGSPSWSGSGSTSPGGESSGPSWSVEGPGIPGAAGSPGAGSPGAAPSAPGAEPEKPERRAKSFDDLGGWGDSANSGGRTSDPATVDGQIADEGLAGEQLTRTAESAPNDGPIGLLALIATVCVVGVSAGALRALITQRANRAEWA